MDFSSLTLAEKRELLATLIQSMMDDAVEMALAEVEPEVAVDPLPVEPEVVPVPEPDPEPEVVVDPLTFEPEVVPEPDPEPEVVVDPLTFEPEVVPEPEPIVALSANPEIKVTVNDDVVSIKVNAGKGNHKLQGLVIKQNNDYGTTLTEFNHVTHGGEYVYKFKGKIFIKLYTQLESGGWANAYGTAGEEETVTPEPIQTPAPIPTPTPTPDLTPLPPREPLPKGEKWVGVNSGWLYNLDRWGENIFKEDTLELRDGFKRTMARLDCYRHMNTLETNNNMLTDREAEIKDPNDLKNNKFAHWGGNGLSLNHKLINRVTKEIGHSYTWINTKIKTPFEDPEYLKEIALSHADGDYKVIVEVGNELWNHGGPFAACTVYAGDRSRAAGVSGASSHGSNAWGRWTSAFSAITGGLIGLQIVEKMMRPILGQRLVTVLNSQSVISVTDQLPQMFQAVGYTPDAFAIATYMSGHRYDYNGWLGQMPTIEARWQNARKIADETGCLLYAYEFGTEPFDASDYNKKMSRSAEMGHLMEVLGKVVMKYADGACRYLIVTDRDQYALQNSWDEADTPAMQGFFRGVNR